MAFPDWYPNKLLRASDLRAMQPQVVQAGAEQTVSSDEIDSTIQDDAELFFYAEPLASYRIDVCTLKASLTATQTLAVRIRTHGSLANSGGVLTMQNFGSTDTAANYVSRTETRLSFVTYTGQGNFFDNYIAASSLDQVLWLRCALNMGSVGGHIYFENGSRTGGAGNYKRDVYSYMRVTRFA